MAYTAPGKKALRLRKGTPDDHLAEETAKIDAELAGQKRRFVNLTALVGTNTALATAGVDLASGSPISVYGHFFPRAVTLIGMHDYLSEAYVKDTGDAKIEVFNDAATKLFTRTLTAAGEAAKAAHTTAPEAGAASVAAGTGVYLTAVNTGAGGTGHAIVKLEFVEAP